MRFGLRLRTPVMRFGLRLRTPVLILCIVTIGFLSLVLASCGQPSESAPDGESAKGDEETAPVSPGESADMSPFAQFYTYEPDRETRYVAYAKSHPELDLEDVVWMVDSDLDKAFYEDTVTAADPDALLVLVNKHEGLPENYEPSDLVNIDGAKMRKEAADALRKLMNAAADEGLTIIPQSGYRSYAYQVDLFNRYLRNDPENADSYSARPGFSEHQTGLTMDVNTHITQIEYFTGTREAMWVEENAHRFGFIVRYTSENETVTGYISEPWHLRYIGQRDATQMHDLGISSLEEYVVKHIRHTSSNS